jgi:hypothetical protein
VNTQCSESLSCALRKTNVRQGWLVSGLEDVVDRIRDIVKRKIVNREIPKFGRIGWMVDRLFGIFIASVVTKLRNTVSQQSYERRGNDEIPKHHSPSPPEQMVDIVPCPKGRPKPRCSSKVLKVAHQFLCAIIEYPKFD